MIDTQGIVSCYKEATNEILGVDELRIWHKIRYTLGNQRFYRNGGIWDGPRGEGKVEHSMEKG